MLRPIMSMSVALAFLLGVMGCGLIGGGGDVTIPEVTTPEKKVEKPTAEEKAEKPGEEKDDEKADEPAEEKAETATPDSSGGFNKGGASTGGRGASSVTKPKK